MSPRKYPQTENLATSLVATGTVHVILTMDMRRWIHKDSLTKFLGLRNTDEYFHCLQFIGSRVDSSKFQVDMDSHRLEGIGHDLGVFRSYVYENFMPTFKLVDTIHPTPSLSNNDTERANVFLERWKEWPIKKIRLSQGGTVTVKLERTISEDTNIVKIAAMVLGLEVFEPKKLEMELKEALNDEEQLEHWMHRYGSKRKPWGVQWVIADEVVRQFFQSLVVEEKDLNKARIEATERHPNLKNISIGKHALAWSNKDYPEKGFFLNLNTDVLPNTDVHSLRDRYVIFSFSKLADPQKRTTPLSPNVIKKSPVYCKDISSLLEGVAVRQKGIQTKFAEYKDQKAVELVENGDLATWGNELCLLTLDNALVYYTDHSKIYFSNRDVEHEDYWGSIIRGIEHLMEIRVQVQMMARETAEKLVQAADYLTE